MTTLDNLRPAGNVVRVADLLQRVDNRDMTWEAEPILPPPTVPSAKPTPEQLEAFRLLVADLDEELLAADAAKLKQKKAP
jgi:hypothetical protein